eukprot:IDg14918t1
MSLASVKETHDMPTSSITRLLRGVVQHDELELPLTCGSMQANRLAWLHDNTYAFATGTGVFSFELGTAVTKRSFENMGGNEAAVGNTDADIDPDLLASSTPALQASLADDYVVPHAGRVRSVNAVRAHSTHRLEVQAIAADGGRLGSVDAVGRAVVCCAHSPCSGVVALAAADATAASAGWAGIALSAAQSELIALARGPMCDLTLFDGPVTLQRYHTPFAPAAVAFRDPFTVVLAEGPRVALYDTRDARRTPAITRRVCDGADEIRALALTPDGASLLTAGSDRAVVALDARTLAPRGRWSPCLKYEPAALVSAAHGVAAAASIDNEVSLGAWDGRATNGAPRTRMLSGASAIAGGARRICGFRADVRIIGLARSDTGVITALSESGAAYELKTPYFDRASKPNRAAPSSMLSSHLRDADEKKQALHGELAERIAAARAQSGALCAAAERGANARVIEVRVACYTLCVCAGVDQAMTSNDAETDIEATATDVCASKRDRIRDKSTSGSDCGMQTASGEPATETRQHTRST